MVHSHSDEARNGPRLCVTRLTRGRGAMAPYLYHEYQPQEIPLYDSSSTGTGWLNATGRGSGSPHFTYSSSHFNLDFSGLENADALNDLDFDSLLNNTEPADMHSVFGDHFLHHNPVGDISPTWAAALEPSNLTYLFNVPETPIH